MEDIIVALIMLCGVLPGLGGLLFLAYKCDNYTYKKRSIEREKHIIGYIDYALSKVNIKND